MTLTLLPERFGIARLSSTDNIPQWATKNVFFSITRTKDELSVITLQDAIPASVRAERGWRALKINGPMLLSEVGVLNSLTMPLASAGISIFAISTYETDYVLVKEENLTRAIDVLEAAGHLLAPLKVH